jgi:predicted dienelactone hydrolase
VTFVIDSLLDFASDAQNRFASGVDAERIGLTGHSGGALTTLVTTYDANGGRQASGIRQLDRRAIEGTAHAWGNTVGSFGVRISGSQYG